MTKASTEPPSCCHFAAAAARSRRSMVTAGALGGSFLVGAERLGDRTVCIYVIKTPENSKMRFRNYLFSSQIHTSQPSYFEGDA